MTFFVPLRPADPRTIARRQLPLRPIAVVLLLACAGCAPIGAYNGVPPAPKLLAAVADQPAPRDSTVVIVLGDNRPGHLVLSHRYGANMVRQAFREPSAANAFWGLVNLPIAAAQLVLPALDGVRDIWSQVGSNRFTGGNEVGVLRALERETNVDLVVHTGDLVKDGRRGGQWSDFERKHRGLRDRLPFAAAVGNHERTDDPQARANWGAVIGPPRADERFWYAFDVGKRARFVVLDSNVLTDHSDRYPEAVEARLAKDQLEWADSALRGSARYTFVVLHHPPVSAGKHLYDWSGDPETPRIDLRPELFELCRKHGVTAILAGHEHLYQRAWVTPPGGGKGFWQVTTGGAGSPLYYVSRRKREKAFGQKLPGGWGFAFPARERSVYHYGRLVLRDGDRNGAELRVYEVRGNGNTRLIDTVDLTHE